MISIATKALLVLQATVAALLAILLTRLFAFDYWSAGACGCAIVFIVRMLINANNFFLAWQYGSPVPADHQLSWQQKLSLFFREFQASMLTTSWSMPFLTFTQRPSKNPVMPAVLLVHGYGANSGFWQILSQRLAREHVTHHAVNLEPVFASLDVYVPAIRQAIDNLRHASGCEQVAVIAHSMGGLAMRAYLREHGSAALLKIITLGTPHHGTALAKFGIGRNSEQMCWHGSARRGHPSVWLRDLAAQESAEDYALFISIYSSHDNIVAPQLSAHLPGAKNIALAGIGHVALARDATVQTCILEELARLPATTTGDADAEHATLRESCA